MKVNVKKVNLYVLKSQYEELLKLLQINEFMMIESNDNSLKLEDVSNYEELISRVNQAIKYLEGFRLKRKFFDYKEATLESFNDNSGNYLELLKKVEDLQEKENKQQQNIEKLIKEIEFYTPFKGSELNLEDMSFTRYIDFYHGFIDLKKQEELKEFFINNDISYNFYETDKRGVATTFAVFKKSKQTFLQEVARLHFKEIEMPLYDGMILDYINNLEIKKTEQEIFLKEIEQEIHTYLDELDNLYIYADQLSSEKLRKQVPYEIHSEELDIVKLNGWIKTTRIKELNNLLKNHKFNYELEDATVSEEEIIPTALENNKFVEPFEVITEQFSAPNLDDLDPNPPMSFWYFIIFGIMMGDIGYGLLLIFSLGFALKFMKPKGGMRKLMTVLFYGGFTTVLFGILHGSFFGFSFDLGKIIGSLFNQNWTSVLLNPIDDALMMLIYALVLGFIQISHGLILKAIRLFRANNWQGAIGEALGNLFILLGLGLIALAFVLPIGNLVGIIVIGVGVLAILAFAGNNKGIGGAISSKLGGLYGIVNQLSDILSYSRLLALALSTAIIAFTFNTLAGMLSGGFIGVILAIIIYLIGHIFNLAMGLLSTYIHDSRLQYVEFFGQFFDGGGRYFTPLKLELNYLNEITNNKDFGGNKK